MRARVRPSLVSDPPSSPTRNECNFTDVRFCDFTHTHSDIQFLLAMPGMDYALVSNFASDASTSALIDGGCSRAGARSILLEMPIKSPQEVLLALRGNALFNAGFERHTLDAFAPDRALLRGQCSPKLVTAFSFTGSYFPRRVGIS
jgi:hypothetical protein